METDHPPLMICEYLAAKSAKTPPDAYPSKINRCTATGGLDKLPLEKQADLCLGPAHAHCPLRLKARAKQFTPPLGAAEALPPSGSEETSEDQPRGARKRRGAAEVEEPQIGEEFEPRLVEFEEEKGEPEEEPPKKRKARNEPPSQPFRREMESWMRVIFKDKDKREQ